MTWHNVKDPSRFAAAWGIACFAVANVLVGYAPTTLLESALGFIIGIYIFAVIRDLAANNL